MYHNSWHIVGTLCCFVSTTKLCIAPHRFTATSLIWTFNNISSSFGDQRGVDNIVVTYFSAEFTSLRLDAGVVPHCALKPMFSLTRPLGHSSFQIYLNEIGQKSRMIAGEDYEVVSTAVVFSLFYISEFHSFCFLGEHSVRVRVKVALTPPPTPHYRVINEHEQSSLVY